MDEFGEILGFVQTMFQQGRTAHEVETGLWERMLKLGHSLFGAWLELFGDGDAGDRLVLEDGREVRRLEALHRREIQNVFGLFALHRAVYGTREGQKIEAVPLDQRLGLPQGKNSYLLQDWDQGLAAEMPYATVSAALTRILGFTQSVHTLERNQHEAATAAGEFWETRPTPPTEEEGELWVCTADGKGVPMRGGAKAPEGVESRSAAGMTPPLGIAIATLIGGNRFTQAEREAGKAAGVLGLSFITEGAIPFAAKDPLRVIPSAILGSAAAGALSMYFGVGLRAPHGGVFVLAIPNAVNHLALYALAILVGTALTTAALLILKPSLEEPKPASPVRLATKYPRDPLGGRAGPRPNPLETNHVASPYRRHHRHRTGGDGGGVRPVPAAYRQRTDPGRPRPPPRRGGGHGPDACPGLCGRRRVRAGAYEDLADAQIVIVTAGVGQRPGEDRLSLLQSNTAVFRGIAEQLDRHAPDAILLIASNPVDVLTYVMQELSERPGEKVIGTGTMLDTTRLRSLLAEHYQVDPRSVHALIMGEHGAAKSPSGAGPISAAPPSSTAPSSASPTTPPCWTAS